MRNVADDLSTRFSQHGSESVVNHPDGLDDIGMRIPVRLQVLRDSRSSNERVESIRAFRSMMMCRCGNISDAVWSGCSTDRELRSPLIPSNCCVLPLGVGRSFHALRFTFRGFHLIDHGDVRLQKSMRLLARLDGAIAPHSLRLRANAKPPQGRRQSDKSRSTSSCKAYNLFPITETIPFNPLRRQYSHSRSTSRYTIVLAAVLRRFCAIFIVCPTPGNSLHHRGEKRRRRRRRS